MGSLGLLARDAGYYVRGSDMTHSLTTEELEAAGITISYEQTADALHAAHSEQPIDWYVYTAALPPSHPELLAAQSLGIRTSKRDDLLLEIVREKNLKLLAVAGTHGKTTTTSMLIWTLQQLNIPMSYAVGSQLSWGPSGAYEPGSEYFVYECDEFDRNFLQFHPELSVITSLEYDHPDTYPNEAQYQAAFRQFIDQSAAVVMWQSDANWLQETSPKNWALREDEVLPVTLAGEHNRRNATLVLKALERLGISDSETNRRAVESFLGVRRRFEQLGDNLYTDYGHTPTEIAATLQMAREINDHVVLVYQPHQNIRQHEIHAQYTDTVFAYADEVYWLPTYLSREDPALEVLTPEQLTRNLTATPVYISDLNDELWQTIVHSRAEGKLVLCMGAGSIDGWARKQL